MSSWDVAVDPAVVLARPPARIPVELDRALHPRVARYLIVKRAMDIVGAIIGLMLFSPALIASAILILLSSPGPVVFRHKRLGRHGREFECLKLRSMVENAERILDEWLAKNPDVRAEFEKGFKFAKDPRVIPVIGGIIRRSSLDEVPQFINILKGEMSLIGPRPIVRAEQEKYGAAYRVISHVKPGLSGLWQVSGRNDLSYEERVDLDLRYVQRLGFWQDIRIVAKTFRAVAELGGR